MPPQRSLCGVATGNLQLVLSLLVVLAWQNILRYFTQAYPTWSILRHSNKKNFVFLGACIMYYPLAYGAWQDVVCSTHCEQVLHVLAACDMAQFFLK